MKGGTLQRQCMLVSAAGFTQASANERARQISPGEAHHLRGGVLIAPGTREAIR